MMDNESSDKVDNNKNKGILIAGVGNLWRRDDGVGVIVARAVQSELQAKAKPEQETAFAKGAVSFLEIGIDGFALLDVLPLYALVIIIDAVSMRLPPATTRIFTPQEAKLNISGDALSTHGFGLAEVLRMAEQLEIPTEIKIVGIEPKDIEFGEGLSEEVSATVPKAVAMVKQLILFCTRQLL
jgi:hydrogenase maturation protease